MAKGQTQIAAVLEKYEKDLIAEWITELKAGGSGKESRISETDLFAQARRFIGLLQEAAQDGDAGMSRGPAREALKEFLDGVSRSRVLQGFASDETATFIFSFKKPLFAR